MVEESNVTKKHASPGMAVLLATLLWPVSHVAQAETVNTLNVSADIAAGSCDVLIITPTNQTPREDSSVDIGTDSVAGLLDGGVAIGRNVVDLTLKCSGSNEGGAGTAPSVRVSPGNGTLSGASGNWIFKPNAGSDADDRVGVVMLKQETVSPGDMGHLSPWNTADYVKPGEIIAMGQPGENGNTQSARFVFGMSCGRDGTDCNSAANPTLKTGGLQASVQLSFLYN